MFERLSLKLCILTVWASLVGRFTQWGGWSPRHFDDAAARDFHSRQPISKVAPSMTKTVRLVIAKLGLRDTGLFVRELEARVQTPNRTSAAARWGLADEGLVI